MPIRRCLGTHVYAYRRRREGRRIITRSSSPDPFSIGWRRGSPCLSQYESSSLRRSGERWRISAGVRTAYITNHLSISAGAAVRATERMNALPMLEYAFLDIGAYKRDGMNFVTRETAQPKPWSVH